jgi:hypothetical protein
MCLGGGGGGGVRGLLAWAKWHAIFKPEAEPPGHFSKWQRMTPKECAECVEDVI